MVQLTHHALKSFEMFQVYRPISSANTWNVFVKLSTIFVVSHERSLHHHQITEFSNKLRRKFFLCNVHEIHILGEQCVMVVIAVYIWRVMAFSSFRVVFSHGEVIKLKRPISGSTHLRTVCTCWHTTIILAIAYLNHLWARDTLYVACL